MIPDNSWYGHRDILAEFCGGFSAGTPAFASIMHGWQLNLEPGQGRRRFISAPFLVWNGRQLEQASRAGVPNVATAGAPFTYLAETLGERGNPPADDVEGTLVFPRHGTPTKDAILDRKRFIAALEEEEEPPFSVSVFFADLKRPEVVNPFRDAGWRVISFGGRDEEAFLRRLYTEVANHRAVVADRVGTAIWYAAYLGRWVRVSGSESAHDDVGIDRRTAELERAAYPALHAEGLAPDEARQLAEIELGADRVLSPEALAELLGWASPWKRASARIVAKLMDLKYGRAFRAGTDERPQLWRRFRGGAES